MAGYLINNTIYWTNFRLIGPPSTWVLSQTFQNAKEESIYGKLYKKNMDGLKSFYEIEDGLEHISKHDFVAMIYDEPFHSFKEYNCKVKK